MEYEWDEAKRLENLEKHEIDFLDVEHFDWNHADIRDSVRNEELRHRAVGYIRARLYSVVYTMRVGRKRIISLRVASRRERDDYEQALRNRN